MRPGDISQFASRLPGWVVMVVALACVVLGAVLTLRPFTSVEVLVLVAGLVALVTGALTLVADDERLPAHRWLIGAGWVVLGVSVLAWPHPSVDAGDLVQERLEGVVIVLVDEGDVDVGLLQLPSRADATEATPEDEDVRTPGVRTPGIVRLLAAGR